MLIAIMSKHCIGWNVSDSEDEDSADISDSLFIDKADLLRSTIVGIDMRYIPVEMADALAGGRGAAHRRRGSTL